MERRGEKKKKEGGKKKRAVLFFFSLLSRLSKGGEGKDRRRVRKRKRRRVSHSLNSHNPLFEERDGDTKKGKSLSSLSIGKIRLLSVEGTQGT